MLTRIMQNKEKLARIAKSGLPAGALVIGHAYGIFGRGATFRTSVSTFAKADIPFHIQNAWGEQGIENIKMLSNFIYLDKVTTTEHHKASVFHINADEIKEIHDFLGHDFFKDTYNIGYWAWELSSFPDQWLPSFDYVDEIWAMSSFVQESIAAKAPCPVVYMPLTVEVIKPADINRAYFGLPENKFLFMFFFDFSSYVARKNPQAVIDAFRRAFPPDDDRARLVIKMINVQRHQDDYTRLINTVIRDDPRIITMSIPFEDREIQGLMQVCDCFVSLHRSEGFGQGMAEAMLHSKPVIATGYSGNMDFTREDNSCLVKYNLVPVKKGEYLLGDGQVWAEPDVDHAAWYMRKLVSDESFCKMIGSRAAAFIASNNSAEAVGALYRARLEELGLVAKR